MQHACPRRRTRCTDVVCNMPALADVKDAQVYSTQLRQGGTVRRLLRKTCIKEQTREHFHGTLMCTLKAARTKDPLCHVYIINGTHRQQSHVCYESGTHRQSEECGTGCLRQPLSSWPDISQVRSSWDLQGGEHASLASIIYVDVITAKG